MYAIGNFEQWLKDNPEAVPDHEEVLRKVRKEADQRGIVVSGTVKRALPPDAATKFQDDLEGNEQHQQIFEKAQGAFMEN